MKYICFAEEIPAIIGGKKTVNRQPRRFTRWICKIFLVLFTKNIV